MALKIGHHQVVGVARPFEHLEIEDGGDVLHGGPGQHLAGEIEHDHRGGEAPGHGTQQGPGLRLVEAVLEVFEEGRPFESALVVEGQPQVLGEGAFTRAVEARGPDTDLMLATHFHGQLHPIQKLEELLLDAVGDHVLGDLRLQAFLLGRAVGDDLFDRAVDVLVGVEEGADGHN